MSDGVELDVAVLVPPGTPPGARLPAVLAAHGYGGSKDVNAARTLAEGGFVGVAFSARGFGESGGRMDLAGPRSIEDVKELVRWLPAHAPVDPARVGIVGASYGGAFALLTAAEADSGIATAVAIATWTDLERGLVPNGVSKLSYTTGFYFGGHGVPQGRCACDTYAPEIHRWYAEFALGVGQDDARAGMRERSVLHRAADLDVPLFLIQGFTDDLFPADEAVTLAERIPHDDVRVHLGFIGHPRAHQSGPEVDHLMREVEEWFDHYLKGEGPRPFDPARPIEVASESWNGDVRRLERWPAGEEGALHRFTTRGALVAGDAGDAGAAAVVNTFAAGVPDDAALATVVPAASRVPGMTSADTLAYRTEPLPGPLTLLGTPRAELRVTSTAREHMVAVKVFDVAPDGEALLVTRGVFGVRDGVPGVAMPLAFDLAPAHHTFREGHRVEVRVAASDFPAFAPARSPFVTVIDVGGADGSGVRLPLDA